MPGRFISRAKMRFAARADKILTDKYIKGGAAAAPDSEELVDERIAEILAIARDYDAPELYDDPSEFFPAPSPAMPVSRHLRRKGRHVQDLWWSSDYEVFNEAARAAYLENAYNHQARARVWMLAPDAPTVIFIHGYRGGVYAVEERFWPIEMWLQEGFNVAMIVLPHHAERMAPGRKRPLFPNLDPRLTIEGVRQAVSDVRALAAWFSERGSPAVGVCGMSLGGLVASNLIAAAPELAFCVPIVPLTSFAAWGDLHDTHLGRGDARARYHEAIERVSRPIDPLARAPRLDASRISVLAGKVDMVNPAGSQAMSVAEHVGAELVLFDGGHLFQFGAWKAQRRLARRFARGL